MRTITAQLTGRTRAAVHQIDGVDRLHVYSPPAAGGYWTARCGLWGHFTPVLHRRSLGPWCRRCRVQTRRPQAFGRPRVDRLAKR